MSIECYFTGCINHRRNEPFCDKDVCTGPTTGEDCEWFVDDSYPDIVVDNDGIRVAVVCGETIKERSKRAGLIAASLNMRDALESCEVLLTAQYEAGADHPELFLVRKALEKANSY